MSLIQKEIYEFGPFTVDPVERIAFRAGRPLVLTPKVFDTLLCLVRNRGRVLTKDEILHEVWPNTFVEEVNLAVNISTLRKALGEGPQEGRYIATVPGRGYRFVADVQEVRDSREGELIAAPMSDRGEIPSIQQPSNALDEGTANDSKFSSETRTTSMGLWAPRRFAIAAVAASSMFLIITGYLHRTRNSRAVQANSPSIAVLPFADLSPNQNQEYFSDGLSEELIDNLTRVPNLRVVARSSAFQFKNKNEDLRLVGRKLGAANILEGTVRRDGDRVRIRVELTKAEDGFQLWSETYDRQISDIFAVQDDIARAVAGALQAKLLSRDGLEAALQARVTNPSAYEAYLQGQYFLERGEDKADLDKALAFADRAIQLDSKYAPAWALRATAIGIKTTIGWMEHEEGYRQARHDADRAIALDSNLVAGYLASAMVQENYEWDWDGAEASLKKATQLQPGSTSIMSYRSYLYECLGRLDEAIALTDRAVALDPLRANAYLGDLLHFADRDQEGLLALQKALAANPNLEGVHADIGKILLAQGHLQEALNEMRKEPSDWQRLTAEALAYHDLGHRQDSDGALSKLIATHAADSPYQIAEVYAYRGETTKAFEWLDTAYQERDPGLNQLKVDPLLNSLRSDSRYTALLRKMRLPA
jgi:TolB-like protein/DNA-binding winged helix-turn-helix (wHTH) protein/Flp pilus assembly protein TadD